MWDFLSRHTKGIAWFESNYFVFSRCTDENLQYPAKIFHLEISRLYLNDKFTKEVVLEFFNRSLCNRGSNRFWRHSFLEIWVCRYSADKQNMAESLSFSTGPNDIHTMVSAILPNTLFDKKFVFWSHEWLFLLTRTFYRALNRQIHRIVGSFTSVSSTLLPVVVWSGRTCLFINDATQSSFPEKSNYAETMLVVAKHKRKWSPRARKC